jgi:uncharacterized delta-60 repeat protein
MRMGTGILNKHCKHFYWHRFNEIKVLFILLFCFTSLTSIAIAIPSDLDPGFGTGGKVLSSPVTSQSNSVSGSALQADGKIVIAGAVNISATEEHFLLARYNTDGSLDTSFGAGNGWVSTKFNDYAYAVSVAMQPDGKIVAGGITYTRFPDNSYVEYLALARYNTDGTLDTTFGTGGKVLISFQGFVSTTLLYSDFLRLVKIAPDGKIVVSGYSLQSGFFKSQIILARLNVDGSLDTSFGTNGRVITPQIFWNDVVNDMLVQSDGSIVVVGKVSTPNNSNTGHIAVKYNSAGGIVWTYQKLSTDFTPHGAGTGGVAAQPDGKFVLVGALDGKIFAMRLNADGTADSSFNSITAAPNGAAESAAIQPDGKIVVSFDSKPSGTPPNSTFSVARYNTNGSLDTGFNGTGFLQTSVMQNINHHGRVFIQPDGKILVAGSLYSNTLGSFFAMVRYLGGTLATHKTDFDFDGDGKADVGVLRPSTGQWYLINSFTGLQIQSFGSNGDVPAPADYDGDFKTDLGIYRAGTWWYKSSVNGGFYATGFGGTGDIPLPSDINGDGKADFVYYRPSNNTWYRLTSTGGTSNVVFGAAGDIPLIADMDGDGKSDPTIFRPSTGTWWYLSSVTGQQTAAQWGASGDVPVPADYDGDGKTDFAVWRPSNGAWYVNRSTLGIKIDVFGMVGDKPVAADYDGDGNADVAIYRPSTGVWYILQSTAGFTGLQFGVATDRAIPNAFIQ